MKRWIRNKNRDKDGIMKCCKDKDGIMKCCKYKDRDYEETDKDGIMKRRIRMRL